MVMLALGRCRGSQLANACAIGYLAGTNHWVVQYQLHMPAINSYEVSWVIMEQTCSIVVTCIHRALPSLTLVAGGALKVGHVHVHACICTGAYMCARFLFLHALTRTHMHCYASMCVRWLGCVCHSFVVATWLKRC